MKWILVFLGSGLGGCLRLLTTEFVRKWFPTYFFMGTLISNIVACVLLGVFVSFLEFKISDEKLRFLLIVGLCGGYSTFSTFSTETLQMLSERHFLEAGLYILLSLCFCILGVWLGKYLGSL